MYHVNKKGRVYRLGKPLDNDLRRLIVDKCLARVGDKITGALPVSKKTIADEVHVSVTAEPDVRLPGRLQHCEQYLLVNSFEQLPISVR